jgi:hypothetical protein
VQLDVVASVLGVEQDRNVVIVVDGVGQHRNVVEFASLWRRRCISASARARMGLGTGVS